MTLKGPRPDTFPALANQLVLILAQIVSRIDDYRELHKEYYSARDWLQQLKPLVHELSQTVAGHGPRNRAADLMTRIDPIIRDISAVVIRGELEIVPHHLLDAYYEVHTVFRETRFLGQQL
jgi:hypothetical protein